MITADILYPTFFDTFFLAHAYTVSKNYGSIPFKTIYESGFSAIGKKVCPNSGNTINLLIVVMSRPRNRTQRMAIRKTWGTIAHRKDVSVAFLMGHLEKMPWNVLIREQELYQDLVIGNTIDSYINLTLKSISMLELVAMHCFDTNFVLKVDEDVFIQTHRLMKYLIAMNTTLRAFYGTMVLAAKPIRSSNMKYFVAFKHFSFQRYPLYLSGDVYLLPSIIAEELYLESFNFYFLPIEDVFVTGVLADHLNITRYVTQEFFLQDPCSDSFGYEMVFCHDADSSMLFSLWYALNGPKPEKAEKARYVNIKKLYRKIFRFLSFSS